MIYFLRAGDTGAVKIGWTRDQITLNRRVGAIQYEQHTPLRVIRTIEGARAEEAWLHGFFSALRLAGEWFAYHDDMLTINPPPEIPPKEKVGREITFMTRHSQIERIDRWRARQSPIPSRNSAMRQLLSRVPTAGPQMTESR